jgi:hypothetical protein
MLITSFFCCYYSLRLKIEGVLVFREVNFFNFDQLHIDH